MSGIGRAGSDCAGDSGYAGIFRARAGLVTAVLALAAFWGATGGRAAEPEKTTVRGFLDAPAQTDTRGYSQRGLDGKARTGMFGVVAEGYKFVYCFDRSGSMSAPGHKALPMVKAELLESLKPLDSVHQFQIVYYNERPAVFNPTGTPGRLAFANDSNKDRVKRFLETVVADGGTDHEEALKMAVRLRPDVIFFLTDGDEPRLTPAQIEKITYMAGGIQIHTFQFGAGPKPAGDSFLAEVARQNGGQYKYLDVGGK
jgi:hypothetical protein